MNGRVLTFHLVGINNQNFVMADEQTGTWWQQVSGEAIRGPLAGARLSPVAFDQLTFGTWKAEGRGGRVLRPDERIAAAGRYASADWEERMERTPTPVARSADSRLEPRTLIVWVEHAGVARAYPVRQLPPKSVALDELGTFPIAIVRAPDGRSTRVFDRRVDGRTLELVVTEDAAFRLADTATGSIWDFSGAAVDGSLRGKQLTRVPFLEEYWFDWLTYHPSTDVAAHIFR